MYFFNYDGRMKFIWKVENDRTPYLIGVRDNWMYNYSKTAYFTETENHGPEDISFAFDIDWSAMPRNFGLSTPLPADILRNQFSPYDIRDYIITHSLTPIPESMGAIQTFLANFPAYKKSHPVFPYVTVYAERTIRFENGKYLVSINGGPERKYKADELLLTKTETPVPTTYCLGER